MENSNLLMTVITMFISFLTADRIKDFVERSVNFLENFVLGTKSTVDDGLVLPICKRLRAALDLPVGRHIDALEINRYFSVLLLMLTPELIRKFAKMILDFAKDYVTGTKSQTDDVIVLPLLSRIETALKLSGDEKKA